MDSCYTYKSGVWKSSTPLLDTRSHFASAWIDGLWWVVGGGPFSFPTSELYDQNTKTWMKGVDLPGEFSETYISMVDINIING